MWLHDGCHRGSSVKKERTAPRLRNASIGKSALVNPLHQQHLLVSIDLMELYLDDLPRSGLHFAADEGRLDGQLAMPAIDQRKKLDAARAAMVEERVQRGPNGAAGVEHIVDQHDIARV